MFHAKDTEPHAKDTKKLLIKKQKFADEKIFGTRTRASFCRTTIM